MRVRGAACMHVRHWTGTLLMMAVKLIISVINWSVTLGAMRGAIGVAVSVRSVHDATCGIYVFPQCRAAKF